MKLWWSFSAANDRGPQAESQVPSLEPNTEKYSLKVGAFFIWKITFFSAEKSRVNIYKNKIA